MGRAHNGYDVYLGTPGSDFEQHALTFTATLIHEDLQAKTLKVKTRDDKRQWVTVYELNAISPMSRNGTAVQWTGTSVEGEAVTLSGISNGGWCIPCRR